MYIRHPLTLLTKEIPALDLTVSNACLLLQDLHAPFADPENGWLATRARDKVLSREFDEYFDTLEIIAPNIPKLLQSVRELDLLVVYSCLGYRPPDAPSEFQKATGWRWNLDGPDGDFPQEWQPRESEQVFSKPGWGALANDRFRQFLLDSDTRAVIVCGVPFDLGIRQTCIELGDLGVGTLVISDAVASITDAGQSFTRGNISQGLIKLRTTAETLDLLARLRTEGHVRI
jgi:nicotinamidase-related amidase